jgi:hypothetical protein
MNDPFEFRPHISGIADKDNILKIANESFDQILKEELDKFPEKLKKSEIFDSTVEILKKYSRQNIVDSIPSLANVMLPHIVEKLSNGLDNSIGILSLSEKPDSQLMWAHYTKSHEGFVIGFDADHSHFHEKRGPEDELRHLRKVVYDSQRPSACLADLSGTKVLLIKGDEWSYEQEWRIFRALQDADKVYPNEPFPICLFSFPPSCLKEVILGSRMTKENREMIRRCLRRSEKLHHARLFQASPDEKEFKINIVEMTV